MRRTRGRAQALRADQGEFAALIASYDRDLMRACAVITRDPQLARDAVQDAWHAAWAARHKLRDPDRIWPWLLAIACNSARQHLRRRRRLEHHEAQLGAAHAWSSLDRTSDPDLRVALGRLSPKERELLALKFVLGLDSSAISQVVHISPSGVRVAVRRALGRLRKELQ